METKVITKSGNMNLQMYILLQTDGLCPKILEELAHKILWQSYQSEMEL